jgi:hypothetical protein
MFRAVAMLYLFRSEQPIINTGVKKIPGPQPKDVAGVCSPSRFVLLAK